MGFEQHHWTDATSLTATELNRIEQGIKSSHDVLDVLGTELTNVQSKQSKLAQEIEDLVSNSPSILETVSSIQRLLDANPSLLSTISNTANIVTTRALDSRLKQYLPLTDIKQNGVSVVHNSVANINTPKVDTILNANSNNPISNSAVAKALANIQTNVPIPTSLADLKSDINHRLVTDTDKLAWNGLLNHNHDDLYAQLNHNHDELYAALNHDHDDLYAALNHHHGFHQERTDQEWGNQTGSFITGFCDDTGGDIAFRKDNPVAGQMSIVIDGAVYVNEGQNRLTYVLTGTSSLQSSNNTATPCLRIGYTSNNNLYIWNS